MNVLSPRQVLDVMILVLLAIIQAISRDIGFAIPHGFLGKIFTRSNWALKYTNTEGGVIDSDYRGKVNIIFHNHSSNWFNITKGQSIAKIVFLEVKELDLLKLKNLRRKPRVAKKVLGQPT